MRIEAVNHTIEKLPIPARSIANLRETARLFSTHYSTMIEGNLLTHEQVVRVIAGDHPFPGREGDQEEVRGYYVGLNEVERLAQKSSTLTERSVQTLHALVMGGGKTRIKPTPYRTERSVILDSRKRRIVYMPPEAQEVPALMAEIIGWINTDDELPTPLKAALAHYQFATIRESSQARPPGTTRTCRTR